MTIYEPKLLLSEADRQALVLLGQLVLTTQNGIDSNMPFEAVALSPSEANTLLSLLEKLLSSRQFLEGAYFAEGMAKGAAWEDARLREIYLSQRKRRGYARVASRYTWNEFVLRAGFNTSPDAWMWPRDIRRSPVRPMTIEHFLAMETKLASAAGLHPRVQELIMRFVSEAAPNLHQIREQRQFVPSGKIREFVSDFIGDISEHFRGRERKCITKRRVAALSTIVMDVGAIFSTRDWTAAGVLSTLAAISVDAF